MFLSCSFIFALRLQEACVCQCCCSSRRRQRGAAATLEVREDQLSSDVRVRFMLAAIRSSTFMSRQVALRFPPSALLSARYSPIINQSIYEASSWFHVSASPSMNTAAAAAAATEPAFVAAVLIRYHRCPDPPAAMKIIRARVTLSEKRLIRPARLSRRHAVTLA